MADKQASTFASLFAQWDALRRFKGFAPDEFPSYEDCCAAELAYERRLDQCERQLLAATPTSEIEAACLLEVVHAGEELTSQAIAALSRVHAWMMACGGKAGDAALPAWSPLVATPYGESS